MEILKFNQFIKESLESNKSKITLQEEEVEWFSSEPLLQNLILNRKVSLLPPNLLYDDSDTETVNILKEFFTINSDNEDNIEEIETPGYDEENESNIFKNKNYKRKS
jgi:hypothetical protein